MIGYIYLVTNTLNNKKYVGRHCATTFDENYWGSGVHFLNAPKKYGKECFDRQILECCETYAELVDAEVRWITHFDAVASPEFYNMSEGGSQEGFVPGEENIAKRADIRKINSEKHTGKKYSDEVNAKKGVKGHPPTFTGLHSEETKLLNREITRNWNLSRSSESYIPVSQHHTGSKMMHNGVEQHWITPDKVDEYLANGWVFGECKPRKRKTKKNSKESSTTIESITQEKDLSE